MALLALQVGYGWFKACCMNCDNCVVGKDVSQALLASKAGFHSAFWRHAVHFQACGDTSCQQQGAERRTCRAAKQHHVADANVYLHSL